MVCFSRVQGELLSLFLRFNIGANADRVNPENLVVV